MENLILNLSLCVGLFIILHQRRWCSPFCSNWQLVCQWACLHSLFNKTCDKSHNDYLSEVKDLLMSHLLITVLGVKLVILSSLPLFFCTFKNFQTDKHQSGLTRGQRFWCFQKFLSQLIRIGVKSSQTSCPLNVVFIYLF